MRAKEEQPGPGVLTGRISNSLSLCHCPFITYICKHSSTCLQGRLGSHMRVHTTQRPVGKMEVSSRGGSWEAGLFGRIQRNQAFKPFSFPKFVGVLTGVLGPTPAQVKPDLQACSFVSILAAWHHSNMEKWHEHHFRWTHPQEQSVNVSIRLVPRGYYQAGDERDGRIGFQFSLWHYLYVLFKNRIWEVRPLPPEPEGKVSAPNREGPTVFSDHCQLPPWTNV